MLVQQKLIRSFILSAGGLLLAAALIRFLLAMGNAQILSLPDPILGISLRYAVLITGGIELIVALICLFGTQAGIQIACLAWIATNFVVYRVGLVWMHCHPQCTCVGSLIDPLHLSYGVTGIIVGFIPLYMMFGSYGGLAWLWYNGNVARLVAAKQRGDGRSLPTERIKMFCPGCGGKIQFASQDLGRKIPCPLCRKTITLRAPDFLKMFCFFCNEHIEFPAHAIGQKTFCPHCNMAITLKELA